MPLFAIHPLWRLIFWISYACWFLFETWVFSRDRRKVRGERKDRGSLFIIVTLIYLAIALAFMAAFTLPFAHIRLAATALFAAAITLIWSGLGLRLWAVLTLGRFFRYTVTVQDEHRLVTSGPYRLLRHPAYTGALMTLAGIGLAMGNWASLLGAVLCGFAAYGWRIHIEERALRERFGAEFEQNRKATWAVIPFVW